MSFTSPRTLKEEMNEKKTADVSCLLSLIIRRKKYLSKSSFKVALSVLGLVE